jgi:hypothetical protein
MESEKKFDAQICLNPLRLTTEQYEWLRRQPNKQAAVRAAIDAAMAAQESKKPEVPRND